MLLADHSFWHSGGEMLLWIAAVTTALGALSRLRPVKWLYRQLIGVPVTEWGEQVVGSVVDSRFAEAECKEDLLRQKIDALGELQAALATKNEGERQSLTKRIQALHECIDTRFADTHAHIDRLSEYSREVLVEAVVAKGRLRQLYRSLDVPTFEADAVGRFTYVNPAFCDLTGMPVDDAIGEGWAEILWPEDRSRVFDLWEKSTSDGTEFGALFRVQNRLSQEVIEVRAYAQALAVGDQEVIGWVGTLEPRSESVTMGKRRRGASLIPAANEEAEDV